MTREEAVARIKNHKIVHKMNEPRAIYISEALDMAIQALEQPRWIPVSERLPERNVEVLVTTEWDCITIGEMYSANDWFIHEGTTNAETDEIVVWMPLPEPYKLESEK